MPKLEPVNVVVRDMEAMAGFHQRLGLELCDNQGPWAAHHRNTGTTDGVDVDLDSPEFASVWNEVWPGGPGAVLGFRVDDRDAVDGTSAELLGTGAVGQQAPYDAFWGARYAVVTDPHGNAVGIMSPVDQARRTTPPAPPSSPHWTDGGGEARRCQHRLRATGPPCSSCSTPHNASSSAVRVGASDGPHREPGTLAMKRPAEGLVPAHACSSMAATRSAGWPCHHLPERPGAAGCPLRRISVRA